MLQLVAGDFSLAVFAMRYPFDSVAPRCFIRRIYLGAAVHGNGGSSLLHRINLRPRLRWQKRFAPEICLVARLFRPSAALVKAEAFFSLMA